MVRHVISIGDVNMVWFQCFVYNHVMRLDVHVFCCWRCCGETFVNYGVQYRTRNLIETMCKTT
jgi:hypothetical protein